MNSGTFGEILILKSSHSDFSRFESGISQQGTLVRIATDLQQCLTLLAVHRPSLLFVDLDFPHKDITHLPRLLGEYFPITSCGVLSESSKHAMGQFIGTGLKQKMFPPLELSNVQKQLTQIKIDHLMMLKEKHHWPDLESRCATVEKILKQYDVEYKKGEVLELATLLENSMRTVLQALQDLPAFSSDKAS